MNCRNSNKNIQKAVKNGTWNYNARYPERETFK